MLVLEYFHKIANGRIRIKKSLLDNEYKVQGPDVWMFEKRFDYYSEEV
jgi:predicted metalloprotease with PDZ domain